jgi:predicted nucleic acid-binding protein
MKMSDLPNETKSFIIDSSGWIEYFSNGKLTDRFSKYIEKANSDDFFTPSLIIYEVYKKIRSSYSEEEAIKAIVHIQANTTIIDIDSKLAVKSAEISLKENLSLADSIIYETSVLTKSEIITSDKHFKGKKNVIYIE